MRELLTDRAYAAGWHAVRHSPERVARVTFGQLADQAWRRHGRGVQQLERNLSRIVVDASPQDLRDLSREAMQSYFRYWREAFRLPEWGADEVVDRIVVHHEERLRGPASSGQGVITALGHLGNWDHAGAWASTTGIAFTTVAERLKPESLFRRFLEYRESLGMEVLPLSGGEDVSGTLVARLGQGRVIALVADRDLGSTGIEVDLLGEPARFPAGPAVLALRTGAPLLPVMSWYDKDRTHLEIQTALHVDSSLGFRDSVLALTQQFADALGQALREHPTDWHMLQRVWTADVVPAPS